MSSREHSETKVGEDVDIKILIASKAKVGDIIGVSYHDNSNRAGRLSVIDENNIVLENIAPYWQRLPSGDHVPNLEIQQMFIPYALIKEFAILE